MAEHITKMDAFDLLHVSSHYSVFRLRDAEDKPIAELTPANHVSDVKAEPGDIRLKVRTDYPRSRILAKVAYHPFWRLEGAPEAWLRESPEGFLVVDDIPQGEFTLHLWYEPSHVPGAISCVGWLMEAVWALGLGLLAKRQRRSTQVRAA
jgi:hypothetical protein